MEWGPGLWLLPSPDGNFYGTTLSGGAHNLGTIFKITPTVAQTTVHSFDGTDGLALENGLLLATDGNFYGVAEFGGSGSAGTIFKMTQDGVLTTLHDFVVTNEMQTFQKIEDHFTGPEVEITGRLVSQEHGGSPTRALPSTTRCCSA